MNVKNINDVKTMQPQVFKEQTADTSSSEDDGFIF